MSTKNQLVANGNSEHPGSQTETRESNPELPQTLTSPYLLHPDLVHLVEGLIGYEHVEPIIKN